MNHSDTVRERILSVFDTLPKQQRKLARFFLDNEEVAAFASANELGGNVGTSAATVVRFCRSLGFDGYPDLQETIRSQFPQYRTVAQKMASRLANGDLNADDLSLRIAKANIQNIEESIVQTSDETLSQTVQSLINAERIYIFGTGVSAAVAVHIEHALLVLGYPAIAHINGGASQALALAHLTDKDCVIVISVWRYLNSSFKAALAANSVGATCIVLTDSPVSSVANLADITFVAATDGAAHSRSLTGIISLVDLMSAALAVEKPQESMAAIQRVDTLYRKNNMLSSE